VVAVEVPDGQASHRLAGGGRDRPRARRLQHWVGQAGMDALLLDLSLWISEGVCKKRRPFTRGGRRRR
jgi:hypothetical protein